MSPHQPRHTADVTARRGDDSYEREVRARVEARNHGVPDLSSGQTISTLALRRTI
jgi:hypothetical protein